LTMKFGRDLITSMVKEWEENYCNYNKLKEMLKTISADPGNQSVDHTAFFLLVEDELQKVNQFYLQTLNGVEGQLKKFAPTPKPKKGAAAAEPSAAAAAAPAAAAAVKEAEPPLSKEAELLAVYRTLGQLQSYVWLNYQAFSKIMKKYDKHMKFRGTAKSQSHDFDKRLESEPFKNKRLDSLLETYRAARATTPMFIGQSSSNPGGHGMEMRLISGSANVALSEEVSARLGVPLTHAEIGLFNDGECNIQIMDNVRGTDVFILQPTCPPVNDNLMQLLLLVSAARRASAARVTAIVPYYGYARQDRKDRSRVPISAADVARMMEAMGVDRVCCVDLHCAQIQGFFGPRTPVDNLFAGPIALSYFKLKKLKNLVVVSPDAGGVTRAKAFLEGLNAEGLEVSLAVIIKQRPRAGEVGTMNLVGSVRDCDCIIVDDMIDTAGTLCKAADELRNFGGNRIFAFATHGLFNGPAGARIEACALEEVVVANTVPVAPAVHAVTKKIRAISVGKLLDGAIRAIHTGESVSALFKDDVAGSLLA